MNNEAHLRQLLIGKRWVIRIGQRGRLDFLVRHRIELSPIDSFCGFSGLCELLLRRHDALSGWQAETKSSVAFGLLRCRCMSAIGRERDHSSEINSSAASFNETPCLAMFDDSFASSHSKSSVSPIAQGDYSAALAFAAAAAPCVL